MQERETVVTTTTSSAAVGSSAESGTRTGNPQSGETGQRMREEAEQLRREAGERGTRMLEERKSMMTDEVRSIAQALHRSGEQLDSEGSRAGQYAHWAADALDRVSEHLQRNDMKSLLRETQEFARREPGLVIGGALALGFALTRFLKSSETPSGASFSSGQTSGQPSGESSSMPSSEESLRH